MEGFVEKMWKPFLAGVASGLPVVIGYFPVGLTFGVLASEHLTLAHTASMSAFVYAGASQFMALELIGVQARAAEIVVATFLMNFRHFIMNASLSQRVKGHHPRIIPLVAFWVTDETFSVAMSERRSLEHGYMLGLGLVSYLSWFSGSCVGFVTGALIPPLLQESMYIGLYALFAALLIPHVKRSLPVFVIAAFAAGINFLVQYAGLLNPGWSLVAAIILASALGAFIIPEEEENQ
jgi:4-azaleucine resistance transporter AzlC